MLQLLTLRSEIKNQKVSKIELLLTQASKRVNFETFCTL